MNVDSFLAKMRASELTITQSVNTWCELERIKMRDPKTRTKNGRKTSMYFEGEVLREIQQEANRRGLTLSRMVQEAWLFSRDKIRLMPRSPK